MEMRVKRILHLVKYLLAILVLTMAMGFFVELHSLQNSGVSMTIVYDNNAHDPRLTTAWGFACIIEAKDLTILFDTGGDGTILLNNMKKLNIDPKKIDIVFLSHIHSDHVGGLKDFLRQNSNVTVYYPHSFPKEFGNKVDRAGAKVVGVDEPKQIAPGIYSTGEMGRGIKEQSLLVQTEKDLLIITGCSHPGIVEILERAEEVGKAKPSMVLGGFHLSETSDSQLNKIIDAFKSFGVKKVGPAHCSGNRTRALFKRAYGKDYIDAGVGTVVEASR
jgi:7,8-dihydropterin-6-yl-methyl-4-(beta-D-ribofuranosyl)aminobenzene 5'-phosphate synthase